MSELIDTIYKGGTVLGAGESFRIKPNIFIREVDKLAKGMSSCAT